MSSTPTRFALAVAVVATCAACGPPETARSPALSIQATDQIQFGPIAIPGVDGPLAVTQPGTPGVPWTMGPGVVMTTDELMALGQGVARDRENGPRLTKIRPDRRNLPDNPFAPPVAQWPPSPLFRQGGPSAAFVAATPNADVAVRADTGNVTPPDTMGDVGPTQYLVALNGRVRTISKATGLADGVLNLDSDVFYTAHANGQPTGDPRVRYDRRAGRWYVLMFNIAVPNRYLLAVSSSGTITGSTTWTFWFWNNTRTQGGGGAVGCLGDYPTLGVDEDALYVGVNQFCGSSLNTVTFDSTSVYVVSRASLLAGAGGATGPIVTQFDAVLPNGGSAGLSTPQGVDNFDNNTNEGYFIGVDNAAFGLLTMRRVSNPGGTPTLSGNVNITVPTTRFPIVVPQPGPGQPLDGLDDRLLHAVIRNGRLWTLHQIEVNAAGVGTTGGGRNGQRWYELGNLSGAPTLVQSGTVFDGAASNPVHHWMGSIMVNGQGHAALGMSRSGATTHVNTEFTGRLASAPLGTMETPTQYSSNASVSFALQGAAGQRWGDYSYTSVDPNDDMTMWTLQEYPIGTTNYATRLIRLMAPPPAAVTSVSPSTVATGLTGVNVTVTGTSSAGSGFFEPGASFPNHLVAAFSGTGVTVTNVVVNNPTSLTLTLNTTGAAAGARNLTVTNPDGQQSTLAAALTVSAAPTGPQPPTNFRIVDMSGPNVTFAWDLPTGGTAPTAIQLEGGPTPGSVLGALPLGVTPSVTLGLPTGSFYIRLRTIASAAISGPSNEILAHINVPVTPSAPANLLGSAVGNVLHLSWTRSHTGGDPAGATLNYSGPFSGSVPLGDVEKFSIAGVPPGTFTFTVTQTNAGGTSAPSNSVALTFNGTCAGTVQPPTNFQAFKSGGTLFLRWDPPASGPALTNYQLNVSGAFVGSFPLDTRSLSAPGLAGTFNLNVQTVSPCGTSAATPTTSVTLP